MSAPVLVVDDHDLVATSLVLALRSRGHAARRCAVDSPETVLAEASASVPGAVLLDLDLGGFDGEPLVAPLVALGWRVLVVSGATGRERVAAAVALGALGWVSKSADLPALLVTVDDVLAGRPALEGGERAELVELYRTCVQRSQRERASASAAASRLARLSARERQVLEALAEGRRAAAIAADAVVSMATVRAQIRSVLAKLDVDSQLGAVAVLHRASAGTAEGPGALKTVPARLAESIR